MGSLTTQLRQVLRRLGRTPFFTAVTLLTLAVGIGGNTAIFSVLEGVLLKPLPYPHPEELVAVWLTAPGINIKDLESITLNLLHLSRAEPHFPGHWYLHGLLGEHHRPRRAGARVGPRSDRWRTSHSGSITHARPLVHAGGRFPGQRGHGDADLRLLAPQVWRRPRSDREDDHRGWKTAPNHRSAAARIPLPRSARPCPAPALAA